MWCSIQHGIAEQTLIARSIAELYINGKSTDLILLLKSCLFLWQSFSPFGFTTDLLTLITMWKKRWLHGVRKTLLQGNSCRLLWLRQGVVYYLRLLQIFHHYCATNRGTFLCSFSHLPLSSWSLALAYNKSTCLIGKTICNQRSYDQTAQMNFFFENGIGQPLPWI